MKDYTTGIIYCKCSIRMAIFGKHIQIYENTAEEKKCPNCGKLCSIMVESQHVTA